MKILFIHPPVRLNDVPKHIPYGIGILMSVAENLGHQVAFLDMNALRITGDAVKEALCEDRFDVVGIGGLSSQYKFIKPLLKLIRQYQPQALIMAGGGFLTSMPEETMALCPEIDVAVVGEGEATLPDLLDHVEDRRWDLVAGVIHRLEGRPLRTPPRKLIANMDDIPYPAYDLIPLEVYFENSPLMFSPESAASRRRIDILMERGCPRMCTFCEHGGMSKYDLERVYEGSTFSEEPIYRFNSPQYTVELVKYLRFKYGIDFVSILDENMTSYRKRVFELCDEWERAGLAGIVKFGCLGDVGGVTLEMLKRLREVGCSYISYGGESASNMILKAVKKNTTVEQMQRAVDWTVQSGIRAVMTFMMGYPDETPQTIYETMDFWRRNKMIVKPFLITPYPGTELYVRFRKRILEQWDGHLENFLLSLDDATDMSVNISRHFNDVELLGLQQLMYTQDFTRLRRFAELKGMPIVEAAPPGVAEHAPAAAAR
jgi:radical SAM superfamily enzyme YgiQ (UPF0313 family)